MADELGGTECQLYRGREMDRVRLEQAGPIGVYAVEVAPAH